MLLLPFGAASNGFIASVNNERPHSRSRRTGGEGKKGARHLRYLSFESNHQTIFHFLLSASVVPRLPLAWRLLDISVGEAGIYETPLYLLLAKCHTPMVFPKHKSDFFTLCIHTVNIYPIMFCWSQISQRKYKVVRLLMLTVKIWLFESSQNQIYIIP